MATLNGIAVLLACLVLAMIIVVCFDRWASGGFDPYYHDARRGFRRAGGHHGRWR